MAANPAAPEVLTVAELATLLRKGQRQTREALIRGEIPGAHKIGRDWRISALAVRRWLHGEELSEREGVMPYAVRHRTRKATRPEKGGDGADLTLVR